MATLVDLLGPERAAALREQIAANTGRPTEEILMHHDTEVCTCTSKGAKGFTRRDDGLWVHSACMNPTPQYLASRQGRAESVAQVAAEVAPAQPAKGTPPNSDQPRLLEAACEDCDEDILVRADVPAHLAGQPRVFVCADCAKARTRGKSGTVHRRPRVARQPWRTEATPEETARAHAALNPEPAPTQHPSQKETPMHHPNLSTMSDAELGALVRQQMAAQAAAQVSERAEAEAAAAAERERRVAKRHAFEGAYYASEPLPEFVVDRSLTVPEFDQEQPMHELASSTDRSPYNKARFRLAGEPALDPETTTYAVLAAEHLRLLELAREKAAAKATTKAAAKPKKAKKGKAKRAKQEQMVALVDPSRQAKVAALVTELGYTQAEAEAFLADLGA